MPKQGHGTSAAAVRQADVVSKLDRLGVGSTIKHLASRGNKVIVVQLGVLDLASPAGKMMRTLLAAIAELERGLLVERTQAGLARANSRARFSAGHHYARTAHRHPRQAQNQRIIR
jgi:DNA invertase Pin-like site-specific DNA recombinase